MEQRKQRRLRQISILALVAAIGIIVGILFAAKMNWTETSSAQTEFKGGQIPLVTESGESPFVGVAEKVRPAVVSISTEREETMNLPFEFFDFGPFRDFFRRQNTPQMTPQPQKVHAGGSGIIISQDGYILTNNHMVENAQEITVRLSTDDEYQAKVIGRDPITDVALIKVDAKMKPEQVAKLGDSDKIKIGDWAIAIGSPFGLDWTVTVGVVSAKGRGGLDIAGGGPAIQDFIQTDASINFGNSGGPLVSIQGEVIGMNTAINAQGQGIGFAIPINMVKEVSDQLKEHGKVSHGYLGLYPVELSSSKKEALGLNVDTKGIFVDQVEDRTPADDAGIKAGDVVIKFNGQQITNVTQFRNLVAAKQAGDKVKLTIIRDNQEKEITVTLGDRAEYTLTPSQEIPSKAWLGLHVESVKSPQARQWNISETEGVLVVEVDKKSPAEDILQPGDVIIEIDKRPVKDIKDFNKIADELKERKQSILFRISRDGRKTFEVVKP
jgi:Do/DeqQ family serine protease